MPDSVKYCYQCGDLSKYLFEDGRCLRCTRLTPDEVSGNIPEEIGEDDGEEE